jgi:hypothetical protein
MGDVTVFKKVSTGTEMRIRKKEWFPEYHLGGKHVGTQSGKQTGTSHFG